VNLFACWARPVAEIDLVAGRAWFGTTLRGRVLIDGIEHDQPDPICGYVPQKYSLFPDKTVMGNITFGPEVSEFNLLTRLTPRYFRQRREFRRQAMQYIRRIGLQDSDAGKYPDQLSADAAAGRYCAGPGQSAKDLAFGRSLQRA